MNIDFPRLTAWYGDEGTHYVYSGIENLPLPWTASLLEVKRAVAPVFYTPWRQDADVAIMSFYVRSRQPEALIHTLPAVLKKIEAIDRPMTAQKAQNIP